MSLALSRRHLLALAKAPADEIDRMLGAMTPLDLVRLDTDFESWVHDGQMPPSGEGWRVWLLMAGRGYGKTRAGAEWVHRLASGRQPVRIALVGATIDEARRVMVEGPSGVLAVARRQLRPVKWELSLGRLRWRNGSEAQVFSGENGDLLRGPEHHFAWCDELAKWRDGDCAWDNLQLGLRAGSRPRALVTTTPRPLALLGRIRGDPWTIETGGRTRDNINLPERFVEVMRATYGGTHLGRQELDGELIADLEGSLWPRALIERCRVRPGECAYDRVVVGVDPPAGAGPGADACGIVVAARGAEVIHVLADESVAGERPGGWARAVAAAAERWGADRVVAEANNGGAMVEEVLRAADRHLPVRLVHASRGKVARAEPVAARFEAGKTGFAGRFAALEDELAGMIAGGRYAGPGRSPDRADAMVWAITELLDRGGVPGVRVL